ncbi:hypothetical protein [Amycolatopsis alkalitolerans]|uniref:Uncharacterized protein n=1 Tax=Amycolatopsis alkalitolerans TaxID=2547244 RepID=A0A5C4MBU9_9PSEU|nr:hypothetical protein [Amycolatopsis alkalitolerans]TNC29002.1 hypothetical protein FG385_02505 [Amycolatopsis alkalitolerans]
MHRDCSPTGPLQRSVHRRLDDLRRTAGLADTGRAADLARHEIPLLVETLRAVLAEHAPDERGRCAVCWPRTSRFRFRRRGPLPCRVYLAIQLRLGTVEAAMPGLPRPRHRAAHLHSVG